MLGGFNLIPAFPLDGGRILRAGLVAWKKDYDSATRMQLRVGIAILVRLYGRRILGHDNRIIYQWNLDSVNRLVSK